MGHNEFVKDPFPDSIKRKSIYLTPNFHLNLGKSSKSKRRLRKRHLTIFEVNLSRSSSVFDVFVLLLPIWCVFLCCEIFDFVWVLCSPNCDTKVFQTTTFCSSTWITQNGVKHLTQVFSSRRLNGKSEWLTVHNGMFPALWTKPPGEDSPNSQNQNIRFTQTPLITAKQNNQIEIPYRTWLQPI